ncbi:MAG: hypothetical protein HFH66_03765 [Lachnospiraceae bacterium]|nr:hypothetical protein [Lachnospiraceae bacterium]
MKNIFSVEFFIKKNSSKGSVTIFLTMILVPMLLLMITLTDYAKISVAKRQVSGAGDVALNAGLSYYDKYLQDMYGLFAVSKDVSELEKNLEIYFNNTLLGDGLDTTDPFISKITSIITGSKDTDSAYMNLINLTSKEFELLPVDGANLANKELLNNQLMDYMKYRGPVVLAGGIFEKIMAFNGIKEENKAVQKKVEFEEELDRTGKKCKAAYNAIKEYNEKINEFNIESIQNFEQEIKNIYKNIITGIFLVSKNTNIKIEESNKSGKDYSSYKIEELKQMLQQQLNENPDYKYNNHIKFNGNSDDFEYVAKYIYSYMALVEFFDINTRDIGDAYINKLNHNNIIEEDSGLSGIVEEIKYDINSNEGLDFKNLNKGVDFFKSKKLREYIQALKYYINNFEKFQDKAKSDNALNDIEYYAKEYYKEELGDEYEDSGKEEEIKDCIGKLKEKWVKFADQYNQVIDNMYAYNNLADQYNEHLSYYKKNKENSLYNLAKNKKIDAVDAINNSIDYAKNLKKDKLDEIKDIKSAANNAKNKINDVVKAFESLESKKTEWKGGIYEISGESKAAMQADFYSETKELNKEDAIKCEENLEKICSMLDKLKEEIEEISFDKGEAADKADNYSEKEIDKRKNEAEQYYKEKYDDKISINTGNIPKKVDEQNNKFYKYLDKLYGNTDSESKNNEEKKEYEDTKNKLLKTDSNPDKSVEDVKSGNETNDGSGKTDTSTNNSEDIKAKYSSPVLPSVENSVKPDNETNTSVDGNNLSQSIGNAADSSIIEKLTSFNITKCVEDVYLTEYVMNMFTYRTYNKDHDGKDIDSGSLKTLSNCSYITGSILNGAEAEYVLWGLGSKKSNLDATYATIYGIRFLMNTVYAFMDKNIRIETTSVATAIAGWTGFGVPIVKAALTVGLALLESKLDMDALLKGKSVPVWKDSNTWTCSLSGFMNKAANELISIAVDKAQDAASKAIDKIYNCASDKINEMSGEISESLQGMAMEAINSVVNNVTAVVESKIMGIFSYGTDFTDVEEKDQLREDIEKWRNDLRETLGVPDSPQSIQENLPDYLLYIAYNEVINTANFINRVVDEIWNNYKDATSETAQELVKKLEKTVFDICKIKKNDEGKIIEVFGKNVAELINDSVSSVNSKIQGYMAEGSEKAKENVCNAISGYGNKLVSSKYKTPSAGSTGTGSSSKSWASSITMDYSEYLTMLLILTGVLEDGYEKHLLRTADLIQINTSIAKKNDKFALKNCKTHLQIKAVASGSIFFAGSKYLQETENIYLKKSNGLYGINYNGVDGY